MGKLFLIFFFLNSDPQMQSGFCFKSKTPVGKNLIMKAFFKGLWQRTHEKTGKREFELQKDTALRGDSPRAAVPTQAVGLTRHPSTHTAPQNNARLRLLAAPCSLCPAKRTNSFTQRVYNRQTPSPTALPQASSSSRHPPQHALRGLQSPGASRSRRCLQA